MYLYLFLDLALQDWLTVTYVVLTNITLRPNNLPTHKEHGIVLSRTLAADAGAAGPGI